VRTMNTRTAGSVEVPHDAWSIYPLVYLDAEWSISEPQGFDIENNADGLGPEVATRVPVAHEAKHCAAEVRLMKADESLLGQLEEYRDLSTVLEGCFDKEYGKVQWIIALRMAEVCQPVPEGEIGVSWPERVEAAIISSFLLCLKVVCSTPALCPVSYFGRVVGDSVQILGCPPWDMSLCDQVTTPRCDWPERCEEQHLRLLHDVWPGIVEARGLRNWLRPEWQDRLFSKVDRGAVTGALSPGIRKALQAARLPESEEGVVRLVGQDFWDQAYREAFRAEFAKEEDACFSKTRIGRALGVFDGGVHLPELHAFLSVCLVLETLLSTDSQELAHKLAVRLAKIIMGEADPAERRELFRRAKKVYGARSRVVHGETTIAEEPEAVRQDAFVLTRRLLQGILGSANLQCFMAPGNTRLQSFLEELDVG